MMETSPRLSASPLAAAHTSSLQVKKQEDKRSSYNRLITICGTTEVATSEHVPRGHHTGYIREKYPAKNLPIAQKRREVEGYSQDEVADEAELEERDKCTILAFSIFVGNAPQAMAGLTITLQKRKASTGIKIGSPALAGHRPGMERSVVR